MTAPTKIIFSSDWHLGLLRQANTTAASRLAWQGRMREQVLSLPSGPHVCAGDVFDKYSNPEHILDLARAPLSKVTRCLAGNHDVVADTSKMGSLELMQYNKSGMAKAGVGESSWNCWGLPAVNVWMVPHHATDKLFQNALDSVERECSQKKNSLLVLHCNYSAPEVRAHDNALNLTAARAEELLDTFDYILIGHEHTSGGHFDGRLRVLGSLFPTDFGNMTSKYYTLFDMETGEMEKVLCWNAGEGLVRMDLAHIGLDAPPVTGATDFIDITGTCSREAAGDVAKMVKVLWAEYPHLLGIRNAVTIEREATGIVSQGTSDDLPSIISRSLKGTDMEGLWGKVLGEMR